MSRHIRIYPLRWLKDLMCRIGLGNRLIEYCHRCGRRQPLIWWADDRIWLAVTGSAGGVYCPECFDHLTLERLGVLLRWTPRFHPAYADEWHQFVDGAHGAETREEIGGGPLPGAC